MASTTGTIFNLTITRQTRTDTSLIASPFFPLHLLSKAAQEPPFDLARNDPVAKPLGLGCCLFNRRVFCRLFRCVPLRRISRQKNLIQDPHRMLGLPYLPVLDAGPFTQVGKKGFNILTRTIAQSRPRQKINKGLRPFDIEDRTIRWHPVIFHTGLKSIPKFLSRCGWLWTFFIHKNEPIQLVNLQSTVS